MAPSALPWSDFQQNVIGKGEEAAKQWIRTNGVTTEQGASINLYVTRRDGQPMPEAQGFSHSFSPSPLQSLPSTVCLTWAVCELALQEELLMRFCTTHPWCCSRLKWVPRNIFDFSNENRTCAYFLQYIFFPLSIRVFPQNPASRFSSPSLNSEGEKGAKII